MMADGGVMVDERQVDGDIMMVHDANNRYRGFAAKASAKALETVQAMGSEYVALIEEDAIVSVNSGNAQ